MPFFKGIKNTIQNMINDVNNHPENYLEHAEGDEGFAVLARQVIAKRNAKAAEEKEIKEIQDKKDSEKLSLEMQEKKIQAIKDKYNNNKLNKEMAELEKKLRYNDKEKHLKKLNSDYDTKDIYVHKNTIKKLNKNKTEDLNRKKSDVYSDFIKNNYPEFTEKYGPNNLYTKPKQFIPYTKEMEIEKNFENTLKEISDRIYEKNKTEDSSDSEENIKIKKEADDAAYFLLNDIYNGDNNTKKEIFSNNKYGFSTEKINKANELDNKLNYDDRISKYENMLKFPNLENFLKNNQTYKNMLENKKTHDLNAVPERSALKNNNRMRFEESKDESGAMESKESEEYNASVDYLRGAINNNNKPKKQVSLDNNISGESRKLKDIGSAIPPSYGPFYPEEEELSKEDLEQKIALELEESKKNHKNIDINNENLKIPTGAQQINEHAPVWLQELKKGILLKHIDLMNAPPLLYPASKIAKPSQLQTYARDLLYKENPELPERRQQQQDLENELADFKNTKVAYTATKDYLGRATQSPKILHENLFKDYEKDFDEDIRRKSRQELTQKIIPSIVGKDAMKGIRFSGHGARDVDEAIENYMKGTTSAILQNKNQQRQSSINAGMHYADQQAKAAQTSLNAAVQDRRNSIEAIDTLNTARRKNLEDLSVHQMKVHNAGVDEQNRAQQLINEKVANFEKKENHQLNHLGLLSNTLNAQKHDVQWNKSEPRADHVPYQTPISGNLNANMGAFMTGQGNRMMPHNQPHKKGGRVYKAKGGQIDMLSNAVQNAVIDKEDPLQALQRLFRHQQALQGMQKQNRPAYAEGGQINPIQAGAMQAKEYVNSEAKRNQINFVRNRQPMSSLGHAINGGFAGMSGGPGILGKIASAINKDNHYLENRKDKRHADLERTYAMEHELAQEQRNQELAERKMVAHESQVKDNSLTNQLKRLKYQAEIKKLMGGQNDGNNLFFNNDESIPEKYRNENYTKVLTDAQKKHLDKYSSRIELAGNVLTAAEDLEEKLKKTPTGSATKVLSKIPWIGNELADMYNKATVPEGTEVNMGDTNALESSAQNTLMAVKALAEGSGEKAGKMLLAVFTTLESAKINKTLTTKENLEKLNTLVKITKEVAKENAKMASVGGYPPAQIYSKLKRGGFTDEEINGESNQQQTTAQPAAQPTAQPTTQLTTQPTVQPEKLQQPSHQIVNNPTHSVLSEEEEQAKKDKIEKLRRKFS